MVNVRLAAAHQISFSNPVSLRNCLGVLQLAAALKQRDIPCDVIDLEEFHLLYDSDFDTVMDGVVEKIITPPRHSRETQDPPDLLGISTMANNLATAVELCRRVKKRFPHVITVLGGPGVSFRAPEVPAEFPWVDAVIRGEADEAFPRYIEALRAKTKNPDVKGLLYRGGGTIVDNGWPDPIDDLEKLPIPAYELCKTDGRASTPHEVIGDYNGISIEAGRGCPFACTFCSTSRYFKRKHRLKPVRRIMDEILYAQARQGEQRVIFTHDIMTLRREYMEELCGEIQKRVPGLTWKCHARFDSIDKSLLEKMRRAGCNEIFFGIEAATSRMQEIIKKQLDVTGFDQTIMWLKELNFRFSLSYIVGIPGEKPQDIKAVLSQALKVKSLCGNKAFIKIHTLVPVPGSELYETWKERLVYDDYGSLGTSDIPVKWTKLRDMIRSRPGIFSLYHHFPIGEEERVRSNTFAMVGMALDSLMQHSTKLAYMILGDRLAAELVRRIDDVRLPPPASFKDTDYHVACESLRRLILELLRSEPVLVRKYNAVARFEIALQHVLRHKNLKNSRAVETFYNPMELIDEISTGTLERDPGPGNKKMYFMIVWDEKDRKVKYAQVPPLFYTLTEKQEL
jgi:radical SAM superfamily enzyme YgiQ (UPF0313 family)